MSRRRPPHLGSLVVPRPSVEPMAVPRVISTDDEFCPQRDGSEDSRLNRKGKTKVIDESHT